MPNSTQHPPQPDPSSPPTPELALISTNHRLNLIPHLTFILWSFILLVGIAGLRLGYPSPATPSVAPTIQTRLVNVQLPETPAPTIPQPEPAPTPAPAAADIPAVPAAPALPEAPPIAVAQPSPAIAFALPVEGFTKIVDINQAPHAHPTTSGTGTVTSPHATGPTAAPRQSVPPTPPAPAVTHLTFGQGEGNQPAPDYPREAIAAHQEGTVTLRFHVDETGAVTKVEVTTPSRYPTLNRAASTTIKEHWHFPPGQPRTYEVPIQFQLNQ